MDKADFPGDAIGYIHFASFLTGTAINNTSELKFPVTEVYDPHQRAEREMGVRGGEYLTVEDRAVGRLAAVEPGSIPARITHPGLDRLWGLAQVRHERCFHRWCDEEKQRNPAECSPNYEESVSHSVVFVLQLPEKCSGKESLCQPISAANFPCISLILLALTCTRAFVRALASLSLALGSAKLAVPTCTAEAPTTRYSSTSSTVSMPPRPITGILTAFIVSQTSRRVMGLMAGPERPPVRFPKRDLRVRASTAMAGEGFATVRATAPAYSTAPPLKSKSATKGDKFNHTGRR